MDRYPFPSSNAAYKPRGSDPIGGVESGGVAGCIICGRRLVTVAAGGRCVV